MANVDAPKGFVPKKMLDGSPYNGATIKCAILAADGTATFIGDVVTMSGTASAEGYPSVAQGVSATEADYLGVVVSFDADPDDLGTTYRKATTLRKCNVVPALDVIFSVQADGAFAITDIGNTADFIVAAGDTATGLSGMELDTSDIGTGVDLLILGVDERPDNEIDTNCDVLVRFNQTGLRGTGTGA